MTQRMIGLKSLAGSGLAGALLMLASPAMAQVNGTWSHDLGEFRLEISNRSNITGQIPPWIQATTSLPGRDNRIVFSGGYRHLVWEGYWAFYGPDAPRLQGVMRPCARPLNQPGRTPTTRYGRYRIQFNADENRFEGRMSNCDLPVETTGPMAIAITGSRNNTLTMAAPSAPEPRGSREVPSAGVSPPPATPPGPEEQVQRDQNLSNRQLAQDCQRIRDALAVNWSGDFSTRPCLYNIGDEIEIAVTADQPRRPVSLIYRAFHGQTQGSRLNPGMLRGLEGRRGLPNRGVPSRGDTYRVRLDATACRETTWLLTLLMSDGSESAPIGMISTGNTYNGLLRRGCRPPSHTHSPEEYTDPGSLEPVLTGPRIRG